VTGPHVRSLRLLFEEPCAELAEAVDEIAERIRTLGVLTSGSYRELAALASVTDGDGAATVMDMMRPLIAAHEAVVRTARTVVDVAEKVGAPASLDLATRRIAVHEKALRTLRATLEEA
jgi:starvation-inducible DNA-binding protein